MSKLVRLNDITDESVLDDILNSELVIYEDIQGSKIFVNWDGINFNISPKSPSAEPINIIDLALQNYYSLAIKYFNSLDDRVKGLLNKSWFFCFEYFPDSQPANIEYNRVPKNNLVLTAICKGSKYKPKFEYTIEELDEYARLFDVDVIPIIFKGSLTEKAKEAIKYFLNTSEKDLDYVFGEKSFSFFFFKILNPQLTGSFLMDTEFQKNLEKIIIRVPERELSFELLNPLYKRISDSNSTSFTEVYTLILVNFLNFCQSVDFADLKIKGSKREEAYISLICILYNMYLSEVKDDLLNFDFVVPEFFDKEKFRINIEMIPNKSTKLFIEEDIKLEYIFKCILGSFNRKRKNPIGIFTENTITIFNRFVEFLEKFIDTYLNKKSEIELTKNKLLDFGDFFEIKYDVDGEGEIYPDIFDEIQKGSESSKKKKGKGKFEEPVIGKPVDKNQF